MPKELKKRGRRFEKQRRGEQEDDQPRSKRRRTNSNPEVFISGDAGDDFISFGLNGDATNDVSETLTFYGLLTDEEQSYYASVNNKLQANDFEDDADLAHFIQAIYRETSGKEIKIASSQSCSRYLEKVIHLSTKDQLRTLFVAFLQDLSYLVQHRFGSHCVEALFLEAAKHIDAKRKEASDEEGGTSFESLFIEATKNLQANAGYLLTERFASHTIRVLMLVLSDQPLEDAAAKGLIASRKKEKVDVGSHSQLPPSEVRKVPQSLHNARHDFVKAAMLGIDATYIRALATSPTGSPVLQLLVRLELTGKHDPGNDFRVVLDKLIQDQEFEPESESSKFLSSLVYDATGAYLIQTLVKYLPGKMFKKFYRNMFRDRIGKLAKNEIASYVAISIFERVGKDDLAHAMENIVPEVAGLIERNRLGVLRTLVERCALRGVDLGNLKTSILKYYDNDRVEILPKLLHFDKSADNSDPAAKNKSSSDLQGSLFAQVMLRTQQLQDVIRDSLLSQESTRLAQMTKDVCASRVIQVALTSEESQAKFPRQFVPKLLDIIPDIADDVSGSHVVDALWTATNGSHFLKERIASILLKHESRLRDSFYGRRVWKNWHMDIYQRRRGEWNAIAKGVVNIANAEVKSSSQKTPIELAREKHMVQKSGKATHHHKTASVEAVAY